MDRRERLNKLDVAILAALEGWQANIFTSVPGIIEAYDASEMTVTIQPAIQGTYRDPTGIDHAVKLPLLIHCPVLFPRGGGYTLTFPLTSGDECLVVFASRCIDAWWQNGGVQPPMEFRMHDISDGFCIPGPTSRPRVLDPLPSTTGVELRADNGGQYVRLDDDNGITMLSGRNILIQGSNVKISALNSLELNMIDGHGVVWTQGAINTYQNGIPVNANNPPAP